MRLDDVKTGASFSACRTYRYTLWRVWAHPLVNYIMLNPSKADEVDNDPTVERCERRAAKLGYGGIIVTNLFAFRATDPDDMKRAADPVGPRNDDAIYESASQCSLVILAWGNDGAYLARSKAVLKFLEPCRHKMHALKVCKTGEPQHPLYVGYNQMPTLFTS